MMVSVAAAGEADHSRQDQRLVYKVIAHTEVIPCLVHFHFGKTQLLEFENSAAGIVGLKDFVAEPKDLLVGPKDLVVQPYWETEY